MLLGQANGGAQRCGCRSIRQEALDSLVLGDVIARVLEPERLRELLSRVLEVPSENSTRGPERRWNTKHPLSILKRVLR